ncbi:MAG: tetratricopeptide repeat protein [Isosphaeraceae bacterium]
MRESPRCSACGEALVEAGLVGLCPGCMIHRMMEGGSRMASADSDPDLDRTESGMFGGSTIAIDSTRHVDPQASRNGDRPSDRGFHAAAPADDEVRAHSPKETVIIGDYEVLGMLGMGGMGIVHSARQISLDRPVALKMIRQGVAIGEHELRRFRNEAMAVAQLDHPGIVPIYEVGECEGRPFFSMKRVDGGSLNQRLDPYIREPRAAASLMVAIAEAVHHAHVRGILHRDLKPSNILIEKDGRPIVTDFGLAKRIEGDAEQTQHGAILGTPEYMSPEQASGDPASVTTASDVYGLGAVLYATLVGKAPFRESTILETLEAVRSRTPVPPRKRNPGVPRDLETICLKCLEKKPKLRYPTAQALADDLRNWLEGRPISARPAGRAERLAMWCRRNPAVAGLAAALAVAVVGGSAGIVSNGLEVRRQRDLLVVSDREREEQLRISLAINDLVTNGLLNFAYPTNRDLTVVELLDRIAPTIEETYRGQPELEGPVRQVIGDAYRAQRRFDRAEEHLSRAVELSRLLPAHDELQRIHAFHKMASLKNDQGRLAEAEAMARASYLGYRRILKETDTRTIYSANLMASILKARGEPERAEALLRPYSAPGRKALGDFHQATILTDSNLAALEIELNRLDAAEVRVRDVLVRLGRVLPVPGALIAQARSNLGGVLYRTGRLAEAEAEYEAALDWASRILGEGQPFLAQARNNLGAVLLAGGRIDAAVQLLEEGGEPPGPDSPESIELKNTLAVALVQRGDSAQAEPLFRRVIAWNRERHPGRPELGRSLLNYAASLAEQRLWDDAIATASEALSIFERSTARDEARIAECRSLLGWTLLETGRLDEAGPLLERALEQRTSDPSASAWKLALTRSRYGGILAGQGKRELAEPLLKDGFEGMDKDAGAPPTKREEALARLISLYENWPGREAEADAWKARAAR